MANKTIKTRIQNKYDVEKNWDQASFTPLRGELIFYGPDKDEEGNVLHELPRFKVGDGVTPIGELPLVDVSTGGGSGTNDYNDLINTPELGTLAAKNEVAKSDLSSDLQTAIDRVDFANGGTMGGSLVINGDLTVNGTATTVEIFNENVNVEDNTITLRHNTTTGLSSGDYTGIIAHKYDGTNDGMLVFDNTGTAYVGDEGDLQPLATRDLSADGTFVSWDDTNKILVRAPLEKGSGGNSIQQVDNTASGFRSYAEGYQTTASGEASHAAGRGTIASGAAQTAIGSYNKENTDALFIVGNGSSENIRNNAFEVLKDGTSKVNNLTVENNLTVKGTTTTINSEVLTVADNMIVTNSLGNGLDSLSGLAIKKDNTSVYGIAYDNTDDTVKLGIGTINSSNDFNFNENQGQPIATRKDLTDGDLVEWDDENKTLVSANVSAQELQDELDTKAIITQKTVNSDIAYIKDVPANSANYVEVEKVGGMTRKCNNLIPYPYLETTRSSNGLTFTVNADGSISITGTATANTALYLVGENSAQRKPIKAGTYTASATGDSKIEFIIGIAGDKEYNASYYGSKVTITVGSDTTYYAKLRILSGVTVNSTVYPMLNAGSTALPYEPYFEGLRDSKVTEIKSIGANLFDEQWKAGYYISSAGVDTASSLNICSANITPVKPNTQYIFTVNANVTINIRAVAFYIDGVFHSRIQSGFSFTTPNGVNGVRFGMDNSDGKAFTASLIESAILNAGSTALPYSPYMENILTIPAAVQALDGWGQGISADYHNYISWQPNDFLKTYTKTVEKVVLDGSSDEKYTINSGYSGTLYNCFVINLGAGKWGKSASAGLCSQCEVVTNATTLEQDAPYAYFGNVSYGQFFFKVLKTEAADVEALKTFLAANPMEVVYIKAAPTVTDISNLLPDDNSIAVEGNGTVTMVNEYAQDVPNEVVFYTDHNEVVGANTLVGNLVGTASKAAVASRAIMDGNGNVISDTYATNVDIDNKVDKVDGKGLSTNDYTTAEKTKLSTIATANGSEYDLTAKDLTINGVEKFTGYIKRNLGVLEKGTSYNALEEKYKDGTYHRMWRLQFPKGSDFWGKIKITLRSSYSSFDASGVMSKSITCCFNKNGSLYTNIGYYDGLGYRVERDFRISEAIWNDIDGTWEILIWQKNLDGNNSALATIEAWCDNNYFAVIEGIIPKTVEFVQDTSYTASKATSELGTKTVTWATQPVYESPYGEKIAVSSDLSTKVDKVSGKELSTNDYTTDEKEKLKYIEPYANKYALPDIVNNSTVTSTGTTVAFTIDGKSFSQEVAIDGGSMAVESAGKWTTARTISLTGDASGSVSIDGSKDVSLDVTVKNGSHTHTKADITDFPAINNGTLTIQKNGTTVKTFTANSSSNVTANIEVPTKTSELTNDSGFITDAHNQVSSTINAMTGYSKPSSTSAIAATDTLNVAIGKLEKALDGKQASGSYASASTVNSHTGNTTVHITSAERTNWNAAKTHADSAHAPSGAQANVIETIKVNGTKLTPSSKTVDITVPILKSAGDDLGLVKSGGDVTITQGLIFINENSHGQASYTIDAMTGYSKPSSTSAIIATDTLNAAIGKLEKALDNKVTVVSGKTLSTNDYTTEDKNKLAGIDMSTKVDKVSGKGLSTNDYTTADKNKVESMPSHLSLFSGYRVYCRDKDYDDSNIVYHLTFNATDITVNGVVVNGYTRQTALTETSFRVENDEEEIKFYGTGILKKYNMDYEEESWNVTGLRLINYDSKELLYVEGAGDFYPVGGDGQAAFGWNRNSGSAVCTLNQSGFVNLY